MEGKDIMNPLISLIIPVYNVEKYLDKCMQSVLAQTYDNFEVILVDDGSTDNSGKMCDEYAKKDNRIKVIHQKNMGLSGARNSALDIMNGDAVTFVDSDDTIDPHMIEYLVSDMEQYDADIVECQIYSVINNVVKAPEYLKATKVCSCEQALLMDLSSKGGSVSACGKLYRKKIFKKHRFELGRISEDTFAIIGSIRQAEKIIIDHRPMYYYYRRNNSITTTGFNEKTFDVIDAYRINLDIVKKDFPGALQGAIFRYDWSHLWVLDRILLDKQWRKNKHLKEVLPHIRKNLFRIIKNPYFTRNRKIGAIIASISPAIYRRLVLHIWSKGWN